MSTAEVRNRFRIHRSGEGEPWSIWLTDEGRTLADDELTIVETDKGLNGDRHVYAAFYPDVERAERDRLPAVNHDGRRYWKMYSPDGITYLKIADFLADHDVTASPAFETFMAKRAARVAKAAVADKQIDSKKAARAQRKLEKRMAKQEALRRMPGGVDYDPEAAEAERQTRRERKNTERTNRVVTNTEALELVQLVKQFGNAELAANSGTELRTNLAALTAEFGLDGYEAMVTGIGRICKFVENGRKRVHTGGQVFEDAHVVESGRTWMTLKVDDTIWYVKTWETPPIVTYRNLGTLTSGE